jgi:hypothetical protein
MVCPPGPSGCAYAKRRLLKIHSCGKSSQPGQDRRQATVIGQRLLAESKESCATRTNWPPGQEPVAEQRVRQPGGCSCSERYLQQRPSLAKSAAGSSGGGTVGGFLSPSLPSPAPCPLFGQVLEVLPPSTPFLAPPAHSPPPSLWSARSGVTNNTARPSHLSAPCTPSSSSVLSPPPHPHCYHPSISCCVYTHSLPKPLDPSFHLPPTSPIHPLLTLFILLPPLSLLLLFLPLLLLLLLPPAVAPSPTASAAPATPPTTSCCQHSSPVGFPRDHAADQDSAFSLPCQLRARSALVLLPLLNPTPWPSSPTPLPRPNPTTLSHSSPPLRPVLSRPPSDLARPRLIGFIQCHNLPLPASCRSPTDLTEPL